MTISFTTLTNRRITISQRIEALPPGFLSEAEAEALAKLARDRVVLEVGAWLGRSTVAMARTAKLVISVDHHRGSIEHQALTAEGYAPGLRDDETGEDSTLRRFMANIKDHWNIVPVIAPFEQCARHIGGCGMAFIDASHDHDSVYRNAHDAWTRCLGYAAPLVFHDYGTWAGVVSAVAQVQREWRATLEVPHGTTLAVLRRG
jgi:hypothetical protein